MSVVIQQGIPSTITQGDSVSFTVSDPLYPAGDWTSAVKFKNEAGAVLSFTGTQSGTDHLFVLSNAQTDTLVSGQNFVCVAFSDGTHRETSDWTTVTILDDPGADSAASYAQSQVTLLKTALASLAANPYTTVNFNGQSFTSSGTAEYQSQLTYWQARVRFERSQAKVDRGMKPDAQRVPLVFGPR